MWWKLEKKLQILEKKLQKLQTDVISRIFYPFWLIRSALSVITSPKFTGSSCGIGTLNFVQKMVKTI